jgi:large subunit ribosomal protein L28
MSKKCEICGKGPMFGHNRSKSDRRTNRRWDPNLQKISVEVDGTVKKMTVCTSCIKSGKIKKA